MLVLKYYLLGIYIVTELQSVIIQPAYKIKYVILKILILLFTVLKRKEYKRYYENSVGMTECRTGTQAVITFPDRTVCCARPNGS